MTTCAAAAVVYGKKIVIKQTPAKLDLLRGDRIGCRYRRRRKAGWQLPIEFGLQGRGTAVVLANGRASSCKECYAPNETRSTPVTMIYSDPDQ